MGTKVFTALKLFLDYGSEGILDRIFEKIRKAPLCTEDTIFPPELITTKEYKKISIPQFDNPKVSIVIPVYNQFHYTYNCIKSILDSVTSVSYEIIIGDDMSTDETSHISDFIEGIFVCKNETDHGFLMNCNQASKVARGEYICFLNNDTQVQKNWLESLVELSENDSNIGLVGSKLIYPNGMLQEAGGIVFKDASGCNYGRCHNPNSPEYNYVKEVDYISGASILIRKQIFEKLGGFDEQYKPAYYEDSDLAFAVRKLGLKVVYQPKSVVVHFEGISNGTDLSKGLKRYQIENQSKFLAKWESELKKQFSSEDDRFFSRERHAGKRILVMNSSIPEYDTNAGDKVTYMYLQMFRKMGLKVTFLPADLFVKEPYMSILMQQGIEVLYGTGYKNSISLWLKKNLRKFDFIYLQRPEPTIKYINIFRKYFRGKIFYFAHDLHHLRLYREFILTKNDKFLLESKKLKKIEYKIFKKSDIIHVVGSYEAQLLQKKFPKKIVRNIPLYIYENPLVTNKQDFSKRHDILFVGGFSHRPNVDAVEYFAKEIFPSVLEKCPDIIWHIVGSNAPDSIKKLESKNIKVEGYCTEEKLTELYQTCRLAICPLRYGAGVKGKVVEAAYNQIPLITTSVGSEGLDSSAGCFLTEDDPMKMAKLIVETYSNYNLLSKMSELGKQFIKKYFSVTAAKDILLQDMKLYGV